MLQRRRPTDIVLQPGEYVVGEAGQRIRTVLGSCVSMTLWCGERRIGAMSHYMLAYRTAHDECSGRYGEDALALMLAELARRGIDRMRCEAKVFGGGRMFGAESAGSHMDVGRRNGEAAHMLLQANGITLVSESLFGTGHREILFDIASGHVWCRQKRLPVTQPE